MAARLTISVYAAPSRLGNCHHCRVEVDGEPQLLLYTDEDTRGGYRGFVKVNDAVQKVARTTCGWVQLSELAARELAEDVLAPIGVRSPQ